MSASASLALHTVHASMEEDSPILALGNLLARMHYPPVCFEICDMYDERLISDTPRFLTTVTLPLLETRDGMFEESSFQGEGKTKHESEQAAAREALAAVSTMGEVVICGRHHVTSLWATLERLLGSDDELSRDSEMLVWLLDAQEHSDGWLGLSTLVQSKIVRAWLKEYGIPQFAHERLRSTSQHAEGHDGSGQQAGASTEHGADAAPDTIRGSVGAAASSEMEGITPAPGQTIIAGSRKAYRGPKRAAFEKGTMAGTVGAMRGVAGGSAGRLTGAEHSCSHTTPMFPLVLAHTDRAALVELLRARLMQEKSHVKVNLSPFILRGNGLAVRRKLPFVYAPPEPTVPPVPRQDQVPQQLLPSDAPLATGEPGPTQALQHSGEMTDQQQAEDVSLQRGGGEGEEKPEEEGMAVEGADVEEGRSEGEQAAAGGESVGDVLMGEQGDEHTEQQHHHHSRGGPGGAGPHHESHLSQYKTVKPRGRTDVMAQVGARQERPHTAAAPPMPMSLPLSPGEAKAVLHKVEMGRAESGHQHLEAVQAAHQEQARVLRHTQEQQQMDRIMHQTEHQQSQQQPPPPGSSSQVPTLLPDVGGSSAAAAAGTLSAEAVAAAEEASKPAGQAMNTTSAETAAQTAVQEARREGLSEAAARGRGAHELGAILDAQNAQAANAQLGVTSGVLHDVTAPSVVAVFLPADARRPVKEVELPTGKSLLGAIASTLTQHTDVGDGDASSRVVVWGRVGRKGFRAALPQVNGTPGAREGVAEPPAAPEKESDQAAAVPAVPADATATGGAEAEETRQEGAVTTPTAAVVEAERGNAEIGVQEGVGEETGARGLKRNGAVEGGMSEPPAKKQRTAEHERGEAGTEAAGVLGKSYSTETRIEQGHGPASMDWDDMRPEVRSPQQEDEHAMEQLRARGAGNVIEVPEPSMYTLLPASKLTDTTAFSLNTRASYIAGAPVHGDALLSLCRPSQETVQRDLSYGGPSSSARLCVRWRSFTEADFWRCALDLVPGVDFSKARHAPYVTKLPTQYLSPTAWFGPSPKFMLQQYHKRAAAWWGQDLPPLNTHPTLSPSFLPEAPPSSHEGPHTLPASPSHVAPTQVVPALLQQGRDAAAENATQPLQTQLQQPTQQQTQLIEQAQPTQIMQPPMQTQLNEQPQSPLSSSSPLASMVAAATKAATKAAQEAPPSSMSINGLAAGGGAAAAVSGFASQWQQRATADPSQPSTPPNTTTRLLMMGVAVSSAAHAVLAPALASSLIAQNEAQDAGAASVSAQPEPPSHLSSPGSSRPAAAFPSADMDDLTVAISAALSACLAAAAMQVLTQDHDSTATTSSDSTASGTSAAAFAAVSAQAQSLLSASDIGQGELLSSSLQATIHDAYMSVVGPMAGGTGTQLTASGNEQEEAFSRAVEAATCAAIALPAAAGTVGGVGTGVEQGEHMQTDQQQPPTQIVPQQQTQQVSTQLIQPETQLWQQPTQLLHQATPVNASAADLWPHALAASLAAVSDTRPDFGATAPGIAAMLAPPAAPSSRERAAHAGTETGAAEKADQPLPASSAAQHPLLRALAAHLTSALPPDPVFSIRMVDAEQPELGIVTVRAHGFGGHTVLAESGVCNHKEIGQQQAALAVLHQLQREDLSLLLPSHDEAQLESARAACGRELNAAVSTALAAATTSDQPTATQTEATPAEPPTPSAATAGPSEAPPSQAAGDRRQQEREGMRDGMIVKITYSVFMEPGCLTTGYPSFEHVMEQGHINFTLGCGMVHTQLEQTVRRLIPGEKARIRPFMVSQNGRHSASPSLFPLLPATVEVTLDGPPTQPPLPQLPRRSPEHQTLFEGPQSGGGSPLHQQRVETVLHVLRHEVPGAPQGAARSFVELGCGQNSLLKSLVSTYAPSLKAVGPPLQLICGIDSNSEALDKAAGELQPYLSAPQQQQQVAPTDQLSNREEEEMPPQGTSPKRDTPNQQQAGPSDQGQEQEKERDPAELAKALLHPHLYIEELRAKAAEQAARDQVSVHFEKPPHAFAHPRHQQQASHGAEPQDRAPTVILLRGDALSPSMATSATWQGLVGCDAAVCLEQLQRMDVQEIGGFPHCVLGALRPRVLVLTTPNWEYNAVMRAALALRSGVPLDDSSKERAVDGWPGHPVRNGQALRHPLNRFEWTRHEFRAWCEDQAARFNYQVRFEELGHVLNEAQAIQTLRQSGRNEGAAVEGEMQVELPAEAAPVTGEGTVAAPAVTAPEQAAEYGGGATQVAVFVCKEVSDKPMEPADRVVHSLQQPDNCLTPVLVRQCLSLSTSSDRQTRSAASTGPAVENGEMRAVRPADVTSVAGSNAGEEQQL